MNSAVWSSDIEENNFHFAEKIRFFFRTITNLLLPAELIYIAVIKWMLYFQSLHICDIVCHVNIQCSRCLIAACWMKCCKCACRWLAEQHFLFSCDQAALQMVFSVRLSVCPSVRPSVTPFWLCSHHRIIMNFSGVITNDQSKVHAKCQGQRSKVKVTEVTTQIFVSGL